MQRKFVVLLGEKRVASIRSVSWFSWRALLELDEELPLTRQAFMVWLVVLLWKRDADSGG